MIGKREFELMKGGALLVNTSRPEIVDEKALLYSLNFQGLGGYANDFDQCSHHPKVISTPHIAGNCLEAREATDIYVATKSVEYWRSKNP
jgi:D-3-phosphoglycerate dehydrogenase